MRIFLFTYRNDDSCQFWYFLQSVRVHLWSWALEPHKTVVFFNCAWLNVAYHNPHYMPFTVVFSKLVLKKMVRSKLDADDCDKECSYKHSDSIHKREIVDYLTNYSNICKKEFIAYFRTLCGILLTWRTEKTTPSQIKRHVIQKMIMGLTKIDTKESFTLGFLVHVVKMFNCLP